MHVGLLGSLAAPCGVRVCIDVWLEDLWGCLADAVILCVCIRASWIYIWRDTSGVMHLACLCAIGCLGLELRRF